MAMRTARWNAEVRRVKAELDRLSAANAEEAASNNAIAKDLEAAKEKLRGFEQQLARSSGQSAQDRYEIEVQISRVRSAIAASEPRLDMVVAGARRRKEKLDEIGARYKRLERRGRLLWILVAGTYLLMGAAAFLLLRFLVNQLWPGVLDFVRTGGDLGRVGGAIGLVVVGGALFWLRKTYRRTYALLELAIAALTGWDAIRQLQGNESTETLIKVAAAVYLVVRGLDNLWEGHEEALEEADELLGKEAPGPESSEQQTGQP